MERYKAILSYDGTPYQGFQRQGNGRTVQGEVEKALRSLGWDDKSLLAAGRTDTGVHASGQVIAFDLTWQHGADDLCGALNALLPASIAIQAVQVSYAGFHPRYDALYRRYVYTILSRPFRDPLQERYAWRIWPELDAARLNELAGSFVGEHDFGRFGSPHKPGGSTVRRLTRSQWLQAGDRLVYEVEGNAFLYRMVRRIVKAQVEVAAGRKEEEIIERLLSEPASEMFQGLAPPHGLNLAEVRFPE